MVGRSVGLENLARVLVRASPSGIVVFLISLVLVSDSSKGFENACLLITDAPTDIKRQTFSVYPIGLITYRVIDTKDNDEYKDTISILLSSYHQLYSRPI